MLSSQKIGSLGLSLEDVFSMVCDAWRSVSNETLHWQGMGFSDKIEGRCVSMVRIEGAWGGFVCIDCSKNYAQEVLSKLYNQPMDAIDETVVYDLLGETSNILGGMIKGSIGQGCHLTLPRKIPIEVMNSLAEAARVVCSFQCMADNGELLVAAILED